MPLLTLKKKNRAHLKCVVINSQVGRSGFALGTGRRVGSPRGMRDPRGSSLGNSDSREEIPLAGWG